MLIFDFIIIIIIIIIINYNYNYYYYHHHYYQLGDKIFNSSYRTSYLCNCGDRHIMLGARNYESKKRFRI